MPPCYCRKKLFKVITVFTFGIKVPAGIFIPSLCMGGIVGRIVGICVEQFVFNYNDVLPSFLHVRLNVLSVYLEVRLVLTCGGSFFTERLFPKRYVHHTRLICNGRGSCSSWWNHKNDRLLGSDHVWANRRSQIHCSTHGLCHGFKVGGWCSWTYEYLWCSNRIERLSVFGHQGWVRSCHISLGCHAASGEWASSSIDSGMVYSI